MAQGNASLVNNMATTSSKSSAIPALAFGGFTMVLIILCCVLAIVVYWRIFKKAGHAGWKCLIPWYNMYIHCEIVFGKGVMFLLFFVPFANIVLIFVMLFRTARVFGKGVPFALLTTFVPVIGLLIIAFDSSSYIGVNGELSGKVPKNEDEKEVRKKTPPAKPKKKSSPKKEVKEPEPESLFDEGFDIESSPVNAFDKQGAILYAESFLNGPASPYVVKVSGNKILATWNWKNASFIGDRKISAQDKNYRYVCILGDDGYYRGHDAMRTQNGKLSLGQVYNGAFNSQLIKKPIDDYLKQYGYVEEK